MEEWAAGAPGLSIFDSSAQTTSEPVGHPGDVSCTAPRARGYACTLGSPGAAAVVSLNGAWDRGSPAASQ